ncbi:MAG: hypothetical protein HC875_19200 [Anaerolineales bacterium]|nr:hypothetical protein [Anaerolineales bacterium]
MGILAGGLPFDLNLPWLIKGAKDILDPEGDNLGLRFNFDGDVFGDNKLKRMLSDWNHDRLPNDLQGWLGGLAQGELANIDA